MKIKIAINGFGRIGRALFRLLLSNPNIQVVAINDISDAPTLAHLLKYDSVHGKLSNEVSSSQTEVIVDGIKYPLLRQKEIQKIDWSGFNPDYVIEATGKFKTRKQLQNHLQKGVKKVILSAPPADNGIKTIVLGVNEHIFDDSEKIISNASCTTNSAAPMIKIIDALYGIRQAYITTVHSYTSDQSLHDKPHKDLRRARAATQSIIPTTTGAAKALTKIFPKLAKVIGGCGIRVPVPNGSLTDITCLTTKKVSTEMINKAFEKAAKNELKGILKYTELPLVSIDIIGSPYSCIFDAQMTSVIGNMVKVIGWYDNESGYASRLVDLIEFLGKKQIPV